MIDKGMGKHRWKERVHPKHASAVSAGEAARKSTIAIGDDDDDKDTK
jgi:hypothetical protein